MSIDYRYAMFITNVEMWSHKFCYNPDDGYTKEFEVIELNYIKRKNN